MNTLKTIDIEEFIRDYKPLEQSPGDIRQFEPHDEKDMEEVRQASEERRLWTAIDSDDDDTIYIESGARVVNRLFYAVTAQPVEDGVTVQAKWE